MSAVSPLRKALRRMQLLRLRRSDFDKAELFGALAVHGADLDLEALDHFLNSPKHWRSDAARKERDEIIGLREYAQKAYDDGRLELALMTAALIGYKARFIGWRVTIDPKMKAREKATKNLLAGRKSNKPTPEQIRDVRANSKSDKDAARRLNISVKTVARHKEKKA